MHVRAVDVRRQRHRHGGARGRRSGRTAARLLPRWRHVPRLGVRRAVDIVVPGPHPVPPGLRRVGRPRGPARGARPRAPLHRAVRPARSRPTTSTSSASRSAACSAARFAIEQKHRLRRLVLVAPAGLRVPGVDVRRLLPHPAGGARRHGSCTAWTRSCPYLPERSPRRRLHRRPLPRDAHHRDHAVGPAVRPRASRRWLGRVDIPTLIVWGDEDKLRAAGAGAGDGRRCCPNATVATFPDAGHLVLDESQDAREAVARFCAPS